MTKVELRKVFLQKRLSLSEAESLKLSRQICEQFFFNFDVSVIAVIHLYLPIEKNKEPDTWLIVEKIKKEFPNIQISIPRVKNKRLENFFFEGLHQLEKNSWGIPEPKQGIETPTEKINLVIVPLLVFDVTGNRVGYGKGFYDKFLSQCPSNCKRVGLSFFDPVSEINDIDQYDVALTHCITPNKVYSF